MVPNLTNIYIIHAGTVINLISSSNVKQKIRKYTNYKFVVINVKSMSRTGAAEHVGIVGRMTHTENLSMGNDPHRNLTKKSEK